MNHVLQNLMRQATRLTQAGRLTEATAAIQRALSGKTNTYDVVEDQEMPVKPAASTMILDGWVFEVASADTLAGADTVAGSFTSGSHTHTTLTRQSDAGHHERTRH